MGFNLWQNKSVMKAVNDGETYIVLPKEVEVKFTPIPEEKKLSLFYRMLGPEYRQEVIVKLKDPVRQAIRIAGGVDYQGKGIIRSWHIFKAIWTIFTVSRKYPVPTRENYIRPNTLVLLDIRDWFFSHLQNMRQPMFEGVWNMFINVYDHAGEYADVFDALAEKFIRVYESGQWEKRLPGRPIAMFWRE